MKYKHWFPAVLWMALIFWMLTGTFSHRNTAPVIEPIIRYFAPSASALQVYNAHESVRKLAHVIEYFTLGILLFRAFERGSGERRIWRCAFYSIFVAVLYAACDEYLQLFIPTRTASLRDVSIDALGVFLSQVLIVPWSLRNRIPRKDGGGSVIVVS